MTDPSKERPLDRNTCLIDVDPKVFAKSELLRIKNFFNLSVC